MKAIILAAGRGSRMKEKTDALPKCLTRLWGKTLLAWQIKAIREAGIEEIGIVTGYHADRIETSGIRRFHNGQWQNTNMYASLLKAEEWLETEDCIVSYADIVFTKEAIEILMSIKSGISLVYYTEFLALWEKRFADPLEDLESFRIDGSGRLLEIGKKARNLDEIQGQYMGLVKFTPNGWRQLAKCLRQEPPKPVERIDMTSALNHAARLGALVETKPYGGFWLEVDDPDDLALYESWDETRYRCLFG